MAVTTTVSYEEFILRKVPSWLNGTWGSAYLQTYGQQFDELLASFQEACRCGFILTCPEDALRFIGVERGMEQYPSESIEDYRLRLWNAWQAWRFAGTDKGITDQIKYAFGLTNVSIRDNGDWDPAPPDDNTDWWSRFWVVIDQPHPWTFHTWGEGTWGDGRRWGGTIETSQVELMRRIIRKWKASHAFCEGILLVNESGYEHFFSVRE